MEHEFLTYFDKSGSRNVPDVTGPFRGYCLHRSGYKSNISRKYLLHTNMQRKYAAMKEFPRKNSRLILFGNFWFALLVLSHICMTFTKALFQLKVMFVH